MRTTPKDRPATRKVGRPQTYFDIDSFASETDRRLCKKVNDIGRRLGRLENPKPGQLLHYWEHQGDMIAEIGSKFYPTLDAPSEAAARKIAAKLEKTIDAMIAEWKRTERAAIAAEIRRRERLEAERQAEIAHDRALAIQMWPQLANDDFFTMHGWVFSGCDLGDPILPKPKPFRSFFRGR